MAEIPEKTEEPKDNVNHPSHYTDGKYECIDYMEDHNYVNNGYLFNAVKYISRAGKKDPDKLNEDLDKAVWYLKRMIEKQNEPSYWDLTDQCTIPGRRKKFKIPTRDYIQDKGLEGTARGLALSAIDVGQYELAVEILTDFRNA